LIPFNTPLLPGTLSPPQVERTLEARGGRNMQEAKRYEGWNVTHTVPYEVLNVANPTSARQAFTPVYQCITP